MDKTNVMRILDKKNIAYDEIKYDSNLVDGLSIAQQVGKNPDQVFKTLVTVSNNLNYYVFVVPVNQTLDLKKAAKTVRVKSIDMIKQKELLPLTGYIHGGCSPIGMKKQFTTIFHSSAQNFDTICVSGGKVGYQVQINPNDLVKIVNGIFADIIV